MPVELATAYVSLVPSLRGAQSLMTAEMSAAAGPAGLAAGKKGGLAFLGGMKGMLVLGGGLAIAGLFKSALDGASDLGESVNALSVVYGDNAAALETISSSASRTMGLSRLQFNNAAVQFSAFAKTIAGDGGNVVETFETIAQRGADFASVMNMDMDEALRLFQSGLAGETEPLRRYGIDLSAANVQAFALANGIGSSTGALTEAEKVQARYGSLMAQTNQTAGDFANTSDSLANRQRILSAEWENAKIQLGESLIPIAQSLLAVAPQLIDLFSGLAAILGPVFQAMVPILNDFVLPALEKVAGFVTNIFNALGWIVDEISGKNAQTRESGYAAEVIADRLSSYNRAKKYAGLGGVRGDQFTDVYDYLETGTLKGSNLGIVNLTQGQITAVTDAGKTYSADEYGRLPVRNPSAASQKTTIIVNDSGDPNATAQAIAAILERRTP